MYGYGYDGAAWGVGGWIIMVIVMLLFWGAVVAVVIAAFRHRPSSEISSRPAAPSHESAERILNERFARGEIDETEYRARRTTLRNSE